MNEEIDQIVLTIKNSMEEFSNGSVPLSVARERYKNLLSAINSREINIQKTKNPNPLFGICYHHNIENFSIYSGIFRATDRGLERVIYSGDNGINSNLLLLGRNIALKIKEGSVIKFNPDKNTGFSQTIYIYHLNTTNNRALIFIAVTSSSFFSEKKFTDTAEALKTIYADIEEEFYPLIDKHFTKIQNKINNRIKDTLTSNQKIKVEYYMFNMIEKIFSHMGLSSLLEISGEIVQTLKKNSSPVSVIFAVSLKEYIVLNFLKKGEQPKQEKNRMDFIYKGINIPSNSIRLQITSQQEVYQFWEDIFQFEHYIISGDV